MTELISRRTCKFFVIADLRLPPPNQEVGVFPYTMLNKKHLVSSETRQSGHIARTDKMCSGSYVILLFNVRNIFQEKQFRQGFLSLGYACIRSTCSQFHSFFQKQSVVYVPTNYSLKNASFRLHPSEVQVQINRLQQSQGYSLYNLAEHQEDRV